VYCLPTVSPKATKEIARWINAGQTQETEHSEDKIAPQSSNDVDLYMVLDRHPEMVLFKAC